MTLRKAEPGDAASLAALSIEVWLGTYLKQGVSGFFAKYVLSEFTAAKFTDLLADPEECFILSQNQDGIDGFVRITSDRLAPVAHGATTEISTLYVQPRRHGKGLGKALLHQALRQCQSQSIGSVWLATNAENSPAIGFYLSQGFALAGETQFRLHDQAYLNKVFVKNFS